MIVYLITNTKNGKEYVGVTTGSLDGRLAEHFIAAFKDKRRAALYQAMRADGLLAFRGEILAEARTRAEMHDLETRFIQERGTLQPNGYNQLLRHGSYWLGVKRGPMSDAQRLAISQAQKGRRAWNKGVPHTYAARLKMRGRTVWNKGIARTEDEKAKMRAAIAQSHVHGNNHPKARPIECDGVVYPSIREMERKTGMSRAGIYYRIEHGRAKFVDGVKET